MANPAPVSSVNVNPVPADSAEACIAPGASVIAAMRAALTLTAKSARSSALAPSALDLDDAVILASLAASIADEAEKIAKLAKAKVIDLVPAGEAHEVPSPSGTVRVLVVKGYEKRSEDHKAALATARAALGIAAEALWNAGVTEAGNAADAASAAPAPIKVTQVGVSVRLS